MTQGNSSKNWVIRILGATAFAGLIAVIALVLQLVSSRSAGATSKTQEANQVLQIAQQQTQIALANEQNRLQSQQLTLVAQQSSLEGQLLTAFPSANGSFSLTATAYIGQATQIEATSQAIATKQNSINLTQTAISIQPQGPISLGKIAIPANMNQGVQISIERTGKYTFKYVSGSYSVFPESQNSHWLTAIFIYRGSTPEWNGVDLVQNTFTRIADYGYFPSAAEAEFAAQKGSNTDIFLSEGEILTLIPSDNKYDFADNPGEVILEWFFVP